MVVNRRDASPIGPDRWSARDGGDGAVVLDDGDTSDGTGRVRLGDSWFPAVTVAGGAAYEVYGDRPEEGWLPNPLPGAVWPYRRFVHATEVTSVAGLVGAEPDDRPLTAPVSRALSWTAVHSMGQTSAGALDPGQAALVASIRRSAVVNRGTRMVKILSGRQLAGHLRGHPVTGFCYRGYDIAHLRTPAELAILGGDPEADDQVAFALCWRATDASDYAAPMHAALGPASHGETDVSGLAAMPPNERIGAAVLGTGFAPSARMLVPEWLTADLADLPLPARATLRAYLPDGTEVTLYSYAPEQRAWVRMCGTRWRHLFTRVPGPDGGVFPAEQEHFPVTSGLSQLVGRYQGRDYEAVADPPDDFRVAAMMRAVRYPVEALARRTPYATWRGVRCTVTLAQGEWRRLRLCRPEPEATRRLEARCVERGVYETWAPAAELVDAGDVDRRYALPSDAHPANPR